jgi:hypothetical protein
MNKHRSVLAILLAIGFLLVLPSMGFSALMDLNTFTADPTVSVAPDGHSAVFSEDQVISPVALLLDPFVVPTDAISLSFEYSLSVGPGNEDYFHAKLFDLSTGDPLSGFDLGDIGGFEGTYASVSPILWDLTSLRGQTVGLVFDLGYGFDDFGYESVLTVANVDLATPAAAVPEPGTLMLMASGLGGLGMMSRRLRCRR